MCSTAEYVCLRSMDLYTTRDVCIPLLNRQQSPRYIFQIKMHFQNEVSCASSSLLLLPYIMSCFTSCIHKILDHHSFTIVKTCKRTSETKSKQMRKRDDCRVQNMQHHGKESIKKEATKQNKSKKCTFQTEKWKSKVCAHCVLACCIMDLLRNVLNSLQ